MSNYQSYKIDISPENAEFLREEKKRNGVSAAWHLSKAAEAYINELRKKQKNV